MIMLCLVCMFLFIEDSTTQKQSLQSTVSGESNVESAISFDEPAQVETLSIAASKVNIVIDKLKIIRLF